MLNVILGSIGKAGLTAKGNKALDATGWIKGASNNTNVGAEQPTS